MSAKKTRQAWPRKARSCELPSFLVTPREESHPVNNGKAQKDGVVMKREIAKKRPWTTSEIRYLLDGAGVLTVSELRKALGRSESAIRSKVFELRKNGIPISLRVFDWPLVWCLECSTWRTKLYKVDGKCRICRLKERVARGEERCKKALCRLSLETRAQYDEYEVYRGSSIRPCPTHPREPFLSRFDRAYKFCCYFKMMEEWEAEYLNKRINANKTRLKRIRRKADF